MEEYTILIPHYKTGKMTAYCLSKIMQHSGNRKLNIVIVDNSNGEGQQEIVAVSRTLPDTMTLQYILYPADRMQSHGIALDYALLKAKVDRYFIVLESDSFPIQDNWLEWYDEVVANKGHLAGSILQLSGGRYLHPAAALYKRSDWVEAYHYVHSIPYRYFPNMAMKEGFPCHLMVREEWAGEVCTRPENFELDLHSSYTITPQGRLDLAKNYEPISKGVFHNGMGRTQESFNTYRFRDMMSYYHDTILNGDEEKIIYRMGYEPGQWFSYWLLANNRPVFEIPTKTVWLPGRENQQQEYTLTANGVKHLWGMTAYNGQKIEGLEDITSHKNSLLDDLYNSLPDNQKILSVSEK